MEALVRKPTGTAWQAGVRELKSRHPAQTVPDPAVRPCREAGHDGALVRLPRSDGDGLPVGQRPGRGRRHRCRMGAAGEEDRLLSAGSIQDGRACSALPPTPDPNGDRRRVAAPSGRRAFDLLSGINERLVHGHGANRGPPVSGRGRRGRGEGAVWLRPSGVSARAAMYAECTRTSDNQADSTTQAGQAIERNPSSAALLDTLGHESSSPLCDWGSRGREFESLQPDKSFRRSEH